MAKTWKRLKNWLIKKLGGFTKAEYDDWTRLPVTKYEFVPEQMGDIKTLIAEATFDDLCAPPSEFIEDVLLDDLKQRIKPYVQLQVNFDDLNRKKAVRARLKVVGCR